MGDLLAGIQSPADLKKLQRSQLRILCQEIRDELIENVSHTGGHLASNLGAVELTVALHYVLNCPQDKIIWDVGHQSYVHKMLTGRRKRMPELRQFQGMSGFPKREESPCDAFGAGHSSTAISAALGMAIARDLNQEDYHVAAVVGDGALTGGMSLEGLCHAGHEQRNLLLILNDNAMSISPNSGALSTDLNRLRINPMYHYTKDKVSEYLNRLPIIGEILESGIRSIKGSIRYLTLKGATVFEELGWTYQGPIDGHDLNGLITVLKNSIQLPGPVLVHVITKKGKGYKPAENNPDRFHGIGAFDRKTGAVLGAKATTYTNIFTDFILEQGRTNPKVTAITAAMAGGTGLEAFAGAYPDRFFDVGICEQHAVTLAAGMAVEGLHPVVCLYSTFLQRAIDQVIHDVALQKLPVLFAIDRAGLVGDDGATHQGVFDLSLLRDIPNLKIYCPTNGQELYETLQQAIQIPGPVVVPYPRGTAAEPIEKAENPLFLTPEDLETARCVKSGQQLALLGIGQGYQLAEKAQALLAAEGSSPALWKFISAKPLDRQALKTIAENAAYVVTVEDSAVIGGFGSAVLEAASEMGLNFKVLRIGIPDRFVEQGKTDQLWDMLGMQPEQIVNRIRETWPALSPSSVPRWKGLMKKHQGEKPI